MLMMDMLPFPRIMGNTAEEKMADLLNYLIQFKEALEFALTNISTENLSPELLNKLNALGIDIEKSNEARETEITQISLNSLTIADVCNSDLLKSTISSEMGKNLMISVNYKTGHLEYTIKEEG